MKLHAVYRIRCHVNGKCYVGRTVDLDRRIREHFRDLANNRHKNIHLQNAFNLHGRAKFDHVVAADGMTLDRAQEFEQHLIDSLWDYDALFNLAKSSEGGGYVGRVVSPETRARMSAARKRHLSDPAVRANLSAKHKGKVLSAAHREKLSAAAKARVARKAGASQ